MPGIKRAMIGAITIFGPLYGPSGSFGLSGSCDITNTIISVIIF